jgi:AraC-like DNA-binding protein
LQGFPVVRAVGLGALEARISRLFAGCVLDVPRESRGTAFKSTINYRPLQNIGLLYGSYGGALDVGIGPSVSYVQGFPLRGNGEHRIGGTLAHISTASSAIIAPGESVKFHYSSVFDHFALLVTPAALLKKLEALIGASPVAPLTFATAVSYDRPATLALRRLVLFLADELSADKPAAPTPVMTELEQTLLVSFLCSNESNYSAALKGEPLPSAPWQVRRVEEYISAHWDQPITIEALAIAANVSARSLFYSFKKARGFSPMALVKRIGLDHAHEMLSRPEANTSVTGVGYACGFGNLGHFANDYFDCFGERPSETLRRSKP